MDTVTTPLLPSQTLTGLDRIHCTDLFTLCNALPDSSVDSIILDPPYGMGLDTWDKSINISSFISETCRVLRLGGFFCLFNQMPYALDWLFYLRDSGLRFKDHIVWVKRVPSAIALQLIRMHESLFIYSKGVSDYVETKGPYTDVKLPGLMFDVVSIEGIDRYIKDLQSKANGIDTMIRKSRHRFNAYDYYGLAGDRSPEQVNFTNVWSFLSESRYKNTEVEHPTQKPLALMERLIQLTTQPGDLVLDPCVGSGTTALAAFRTGRHYICGDILPQYVEIARRRVQNADPFQHKQLDNGYVQLSLFQESA